MGRGSLTLLGVATVWRRARPTHPGGSRVATPPAEVVDRLVDPRSREAEARRLGRERSREAVPLLRKFSSDRDPRVRAACVWALGEIGDPESVQAVRVRVNDQAEAVRLEVARALGKLYCELAERKTLYRERVSWVTTWEPGMDAAIGHAFLALVFDDPCHGRRAAALMMERSRVPPYGGEHGERFPRPVSLFPFAYDLGYRFLEPAEREAIAANFISFYNHYGVEWGPRGIFAVSRGVFAVPGLMGLAVLKDKGDFDLAEPARPKEVVEFRPEELGPHAGVPLNVLEPGSMPRRWLMAGPFDDPEADLLERIGGPAAWPQFGTGVPHKGTTFRFVSLPEDSVRVFGQTRPAVEYLAIPASGPRSVTYLYCLLKVSRRAGGYVHKAYPLGARWQRAWLDGKELRDDTIVVLRPGAHRLLVEARGTSAAPSFPPVDPGVALAELKKYQWATEQWRDARERHEKTGELQSVAWVFEMCRRGVRTWCMEEMRKSASGQRPRLGGAIAAFISACRTALGEGLVPDTPVPIAPERLDSRALCFALGLAPPRLREVVVEEFNRRFLPDKLGKLSCLDLVAAYVNYPLEALRRWPGSSRR